MKLNAIPFYKITTPALATLLTLHALGSVPTSSASPTGPDATDAPVPVSSYVNDNSPIVENPSELTVQDIEKYLQEKHASEAAANGEALDSEYVRIPHFNPASAAGKIVIKVHESTDPENPEYLEVFRQQSEDPTDVEAVDLFDNATSNRALISTAGTFNGRKYVTPTGDFAIDSLQPMHHSSAYNDAPMPWSMFFNGGIAIHAATPSEYNDLGRVASHGCVRMHLDNAKLLYDLVDSTKSQGQWSAVVEVLGN